MADEPRANLTAQRVDAAMLEIIASGVFKVDDAPLAAILGTRIVERDGTTDKSYTRNRFSDIRIILSFASARNNTCGDTRCAAVVENEIKPHSTPA
ncbi:DUF2922 domain-containing protein [Sporosarcina sp. NPDC096371]|uniref:DUF2922 domain-containing protein n=1 Tax=Sporosarcina sp. NPDC096371 TaxID=3364530 RepID=UPI00381A3B11